MWDVKTALRRQIAAERVLVIADACHSAGTTESAIPFQEVYDHVSTQVVEATDGQQRPQKTGFGDIPLAVVEGRTNPRACDVSRSSGICSRSQNGCSGNRRSIA